MLVFEDERTGTSFTWMWRRGKSKRSSERRRRWCWLQRVCSSFTILCICFIRCVSRLWRSALAYFDSVLLFTFVVVQNHSHHKKIARVNFSWMTSHKKCSYHSLLAVYFDVLAEVIFVTINSRNNMRTKAYLFILSPIIKLILIFSWRYFNWTKSL